MRLRYVQDLSNVRICKKYRCTKGTYGLDFSRTIVGCIFVVSLLMLEFGGLVFLDVARFLIVKLRFAFNNSFFREIKNSRKFRRFYSLYFSAVGVIVEKMKMQVFCKFSVVSEFLKF